MIFTKNVVVITFLKLGIVTKSATGFLTTPTNYSTARTRLSSLRFVASISTFPLESSTKGVTAKANSDTFAPTPPETKYALYVSSLSADFP